MVEAAVLQFSRDEHQLRDAPLVPDILRGGRRLVLGGEMLRRLEYSRRRLRWASSFIKHRDDILALVTGVRCTARTRGDEQGCNEHDTWRARTSIVETAHATAATQALHLARDSEAVPLFGNK